MIRLDSDLLLKALLRAHEQPDKIKRTPVADDVVRWLKDNIPHEELISFIVSEAWDDTIQLYALNFHTAREIMDDTTRSAFIGKHFVVIGAAPNGDPVAIPREGFDLVGYISHDELAFEGDDIVGLKFLPVSSSLGEFFYSTWTVDGYPVDYYQAQDWEGTQPLRAIGRDWLE